MTALGAEGTRKWYPFEGGGEGSVLEGGRMEIVGGRVCTDAELYSRDGIVSSLWWLSTTQWWLCAARGGCDFDPLVVVFSPWRR